MELYQNKKNYYQYFNYKYFDFKKIQKILLEFFCKLEGSALKLGVKIQDCLNQSFFSSFRLILVPPKQPAHR